MLGLLELGDGDEKSNTVIRHDQDNQLFLAIWQVPISSWFCP